MGEGKREAGIGKMLLGSAKFFAIVYLLVAILYFAGMGILEPLFSPIGAIVLFGGSATTYISEA